MYINPETSKSTPTKSPEIQNAYDGKIAMVIRPKINFNKVIINSNLQLIISLVLYANAETDSAEKIK